MTTQTSTLTDMRLISASVGARGVNRLDDVRTIQRVINALISRIVPWAALLVDGRVGKATIGAIEEFQRRVVGTTVPDGRVDPRGKTERTMIGLLSPVQNAKEAEVPRWYRIAEQEIGVREVPGLAKNNKRILEYIASIPQLSTIPYKVFDKEAGKKVRSGFMMGDVDETAWCACFVNWCLQKSERSTRGMTAKAIKWTEYGTPLPSGAPKLGAIAVVYRTPSRHTTGITSTGNHVAFYAGGPANAPILLGGNQGNQVSKKSFAGWDVIAYRWPPS